MIDDPHVREFIVAFADDEHLMGQQHTEWIGVAPFLEEDLAFASIGQDELGHAASLYALLAGEDDQAIDELAFGRDPSEYRSCQFVEFVTTDWAAALVRHALYDSAEQLRWELLEDSSISELAELALAVRGEEVFHRRHADGLLDVLLATQSARRQVLSQLQQQLPLALAMFEGVAGEDVCVRAGVARAPFASQLPAWTERVQQRFATVHWDVDTVVQRRRTMRSDDFGPLLERMNEVFAIDPTAVW